MGRTSKLDRRLGAAIALLAAAMSAGCGAKDDAKAASQVAARVNGDEITVHQVNYLLSRRPDLTAESASPAKREIVDGLIEQQLARQQAIARKLDRTPAVVQALDAARNAILWGAYLEHVAAAQPVPADAEIRKYYAAHPFLFAQRRLFTLEEIIVPARPGLAAELRAQAARARTMTELAAWLKSRNAEFSVGRGVRAAEEIALGVLPQLQAMKRGEIRVVEAGERLNVFRLAAVQPAPVDEPTAAPRIRQLLINQRAAQAIATEMAQLKRQGKIQYIGEFAEGAPPAAAKPGADVAAAPETSFRKAVRALR